MAPLSFVIVGAGWRAMFYVRIALRYPRCFRLSGLLCRSGERADAVRREYGVPATDDPEACAAARPDFVVVAVDRDSKFQVTKEWLDRGFAVLSETPAGRSPEELEALWELGRGGARLQIAEQYPRYPLIAAGLETVERGALGDPYAVELSLAHGCHAAGLMRHMLRLQARRLPDFRLWGRAYAFPVEETDSRRGPVTDGSVKERVRDRVTLEFEGGKVGFYDFDSVQYHSAIRSRHINLRGPRGEWNDTVARYVDAAHRPVREELRPRLDPAYAVLHTPELTELSRVWRPEARMESWQDEFAIATMLLDMGRLARGGAEGYPLAEALEDAYTWLLMRRAIRSPGQIVASRPRPWQGR